MIALSAPVPMPAMMRRAMKMPHSLLIALKNEATQYTTSAHIMMRRRPIRSPRAPADSAPKKNPMKLALATMPSWGPANCLSEPAAQRRSRQHPWRRRRNQGRPEAAGGGGIYRTAGARCGRIRHSWVNLARGVFLKRPGGGRVMDGHRGNVHGSHPLTANG